jgi:hypothetical protein
MGEKFVIKNPDGRVQRVCCIVEGPSECKKCGIPNTLGYARDQGYLPRFGKYGSFDNYGGTVQYILACQGNRRQCGACWKKELGATWELAQVVPPSLSP